MYPNHYDGTNNSRVRNVPIQVERRDDIRRDASSSPESQRHYQTRQQRHGRFQNDHQQSHRHEPYYYEHPYRQNQQDSHTTSVDIKHQAPDARLRQQQQQQHQSSHDDDRQSNGSDKVEKTRDDTNTESQKQNSRANQEDKGLKHSESFNLPLLKGNEPIPMPPPPEPKPAHIGQVNDENRQHHHQPQEQRQQQQQAQMQDAINTIADAKAEAQELLNEVQECNEISLQSKKYLYLHEHLERCILKLDNVQVPELRPQRKAAVEMVHKCLDILKRKVELNYDIHLIAAKSS